MVRKYQSCAFVGNSPSIIDTSSEGFGEAIDAHEAVVRFNKAMPSGMVSKYVGSRETIRFINASGTRMFIQVGFY